MKKLILFGGLLCLAAAARGGGQGLSAEKLKAKVCFQEWWGEYREKIEAALEKTSAFCKTLPLRFKIEKPDPIQSLSRHHRTPPRQATSKKTKQ